MRVCGGALLNCAIWSSSTMAGTGPSIGVATALDTVAPFLAGLDGHPAVMLTRCLLERGALHKAYFTFVMDSTHDLQSPLDWAAGSYWWCSSSSGQGLFLLMRVASWFVGNAGCWHVSSDQLAPPRSRESRWTWRWRDGQGSAQQGPAVCDCRHAYSRCCGSFSQAWLC